MISGQISGPISGLTFELISGLMSGLISGLSLGCECDWSKQHTGQSRCQAIGGQMRERLKLVSVACHRNEIKIHYVYVFLKVYYWDRSLLGCLSAKRYVLPAKRQVPPHAHWLNMRCQHAAVPWKNSFHKNKNKNFLQPSDVMHSIPSVRLYMLVYRGAAVNPKRGCFRDPKEELIDPGGTEIRKRSDTLCPRLSSC